MMNSHHTLVYSSLISAYPNTFIVWLHYHKKNIMLDKWWKKNLGIRIFLAWYSIFLHKIGADTHPSHCFATALWSILWNHMEVWGKVRITSRVALCRFLAELCGHHYLFLFICTCLRAVSLQFLFCLISLQLSSVRLSLKRCGGFKRLVGLVGMD